MNAYIYQADIYCEECAREIKARLRKKIEAKLDAKIDAINAATPDTNDESFYDSDEYPKGPYGNGGGESDTPQHCARCKEFLENPLTSDGYAYVQEAKKAEWDSFYDIERGEELT